VGRGADIEARNGNGQTSLMLAAAAGHAPLVEWLIERGAALDHTAKYRPERLDARRYPRPR
jgi:ankyrin repeat protein